MLSRLVISVLALQLFCWAAARPCGATLTVRANEPIVIAPDQTSGHGTLVLISAPAEENTPGKPNGGDTAPSGGTTPGAAPAQNTGTTPGAAPAQGSGATPGATPAPKSPASEPVQLAVGAFVAETGGAPLRGTLELRAPVAELAPGTRVVIEVRATDIFFEGTALVDVLNQGEKIGTLRIHRAPLTVRLVEPAVTLHPGGRGTLTLHNDTLYPLELRWRLRLGDDYLCEPQVTPSSAAAESDEKHGAAGSGAAGKGGANASAAGNGGANASAAGNGGANARSPNAGGAPAAAGATATTGKAGAAGTGSSPNSAGADSTSSACGGAATESLLLPPRSSGHLSFTVPKVSMWSAAFYSRRTQAAVLWLGSGDGALRRELGFQAHVEGRFYPGERGWIFALLFAGAFASLFVRYWVPNTQRKRQLQAQVRGVCLQIGDFSDEIRSQLREQTRSECEMLCRRLDSRFTLNPDYGALADECASMLAHLEQRVMLIERIDTARARLIEFWNKCPPPTLVDQVEGLLDSASDGLLMQRPSPNELGDIAGYIARAMQLADSYRGSSTPTDGSFGVELLARARVALAEKAEYQAKLPFDFSPLFASIERQVPPELRTTSATSAAPGEASPPAAATLPSRVWSNLDYDLCSFEVWKDFVWLFRAAPANGPPAAGSNGTVATLQATLAAQLGRNSWSELRAARHTLKEFRERSTRKHVEEAIASSAMYIEREPKRITYPQVVSFRIRFIREELNWASAREHFSPAWSFAGEREPASYGEQDRWEVSHLYVDERRWWQIAVGWLRRNLLLQDSVTTEPVSVIFRFKENDSHRMGEPIPQASPLTTEVEVDGAGTGERRRRLQSEVLSLLVSVSVPMFSLIATARENLAQQPGSTGLLVFLLGFGSDTVVAAFRQQPANGTERTPAPAPLPPPGKASAPTTTPAR